MRNYYRVILGEKNSFAEEAHNGNYIGVGWLPEVELTGKLTENWRDFNKKFIPLYLKKHPDKSNISAGLACGMLHTLTKGIVVNDIILCPDGKGNYYIGEVMGDYEYHKMTDLPHRRPVRWFPNVIARNDMSESLRNSAGSIGTISNLTKYSQEIDGFISGVRPLMLSKVDQIIEDPSVFALEKHLEDFLVLNWQHTELAKHYDIFTDGETNGQQYPTDTGPIDILAISKDRKTLLIVELKRGRASDVVVGQVQRYMGYVKDELVEKNQKVRGAIIAYEEDNRISRALSVAKDIDFYTYKISFKLDQKK